MFSRKNFTWKKWLVYTAYMFIVTLLISLGLSLLVKETPEARAQLLSPASLAERLVAAILTGIALSFMRLSQKH